MEIFKIKISLEYYIKGDFFITLLLKNFYFLGFVERTLTPLAFIISPNSST